MYCMPMCLIIFNIFVLTVLAFALLDLPLVLDVLVARLAVEPGPVIKWEKKSFRMLEVGAHQAPNE